MRQHRKIAAFCAGTTLIAAGGWLLSRPKVRPAENVSHENAFLAEQLNLEPGHTPILLRLAQIERSEGNLSAARKYLEQAVAVDGGQVEVRLELGLVCSEIGDLASAEEQNRAVLLHDPHQPDALYNLGAILANRGDFIQARTFWNDAVRGGIGSSGGAKASEALKRLETMR